MSTESQENHNADKSSAFYANNDASSYNSRYLKSIRNKERFQELHFFAAATELLDELFPKQPNKGSLDPTYDFRASAVTLKQWRELDEADQLLAIQKEKEKSLVGNGGVEPSSRIASQDALVSSGEPAVAGVAPPAAKVARTGEKVGETGNTAASADESINFCKGRVCQGLSLSMLKASFPNDLALEPGFKSLVGNAMQHKANIYATGGNWPYASEPGIAGCLYQEVGGELDLLWICSQVSVADDGTPINSKSKLDGIHFHHFSCLPNSATVPCNNCSLNLNLLVDLCRKAAQT